MFHVSTYLPFMSKDPQQVERKRHIGNDMVVIVFREGRGLFNPENLRSEYNHVFVLVQYEKGSRDSPASYRVEIARKLGVVESEPPLPDPPIFTLGSQFREFLLTKLINLERATYFAKTFSVPIERTRLTLLNNLFEKVVPDKNNNV
jgi:RAP1 GTPase activating protein 1